MLAPKKTKVYLNPSEVETVMKFIGDLTLDEYTVAKVQDSIAYSEVEDQAVSKLMKIEEEIQHELLETALESIRVADKPPVPFVEPPQVPKTGDFLVNNICWVDQLPEPLGTWGYNVIAEANSVISMYNPIRDEWEFIPVHKILKELLVDEDVILYKGCTMPTVEFFKKYYILGHRDIIDRPPFKYWLIVVPIETDVGTLTKGKHRLLSSPTEEHRGAYSLYLEREVDYKNISENLKLVKERRQKEFEEREAKRNMKKKDE